MIYKGKIINFELLYTTRDIDLLSLTTEIIISELDIAIKEKCNAIIGLLLVDGFLYKNNEPFYQMLDYIQLYCFANNIKKLTLVVGMCENYQAELDKRNLKYEIIFWDFNINLVYQGYKNKKIYNWNNSANKFLFLGGVPSRANRIILLNKIYNRGLLKDAEWSFFPPWTPEDKIWCRNALFSEENYNQFLNDCDRSIDKLYKESKNYSRYSSEQILKSNIHNSPWCQEPGFINSLIFKNTLFSIISEGNAYSPATDYRFLTEKTWRTVANNHPFILAGEIDQFKYLKSKGLYTFEEYLYPYSEIENENCRFNTIIDNIPIFFKKIKSHNQEISEKINYNSKIFWKEIEKNQIILNNISSTYSIDKEEIIKWFGQKSFVHLTKVIE